MPHIEVDQQAVHVHFTRSEKALGLLRDLTVPRSSIVDVELTPDSRSAVRGWWRTGTSIPRLLHVGVWRQHQHRQLVVARRQRPGVVIRLRDHRYDDLVLAVPDARRVYESLRRAPDLA